MLNAPGRTRRSFIIAAVTAAGCLAGVAAAQPEPYRIPPELATLLSEGDARVVVIGDSISTNFGGEVNGANHTPWTVGIHRRWRPRAWRGIYAPVGIGVPSGYTTMRGVGASFYGNPDAAERVVPMRIEEAWPDGHRGFATEPAAMITFDNLAIFSTQTPRFEFRIYPDGLIAGSAASGAVLASDSLIARHIVYSPAYETDLNIDLELVRIGGSRLFIADAVRVPIGHAGWTTVDFDLAPLRAAGFDPATQALAARPRVATEPTNDTLYYSDGMLFLASDQPGMLVASIAEGGWRNDDHLRRLGTGRGYSNEGLASKLRALGFADPGSTPVIVIATGTNIGLNEGNGPQTTIVYRQNVEAIAARVRAAIDEIGGAEPYLLLVGMYSWGFAPDNFVATRAGHLADIAAADPRAGFVSLPALLGDRGGTFDSDWYFRQPEAIGITPLVNGVITLDDASDFPSSGQIWITDGVNQWYASYGLRIGNELRSVVGSPPTLPAGVRILSNLVPDLHLSLAGADAAAQAVWDAIEASLPVCIADWDASGGVDGDDIGAFFADWQRGEADADSSGGTDGDDIAFFFERWQAGC